MGRLPNMATVRPVSTPTVGLSDCLTWQARLERVRKMVPPNSPLKSDSAELVNRCMAAAEAIPELKLQPWQYASCAASCHSSQV